MAKLQNIFTRQSFWLAALVFLLALLPRITTLGGTFIVNDEPLYWQWTNDFANALLKGDWRGTMIGIGYPSITVTWVHTLGIGLEAALRWLTGSSPAEMWRLAALDQPFIFNQMADRRVVMGVANALVILLIYLQARRLLGQPVALLGAVLMAFCPFLLADARTMRGDALLSGLMLLSGLSLLNYLRQPRLPRLILAGVAFGLALLTKMTALPLAGFMGLAVLAYALCQTETPWPSRLRRSGITLAVGGALTAFTFWALWPALWVAPLQVWEFMRGYAEGSLDGRLNFFWGQLTTDEQIWLFYPNAFLFRANPVVVLGVAVIIGLALTGGWQLLRRQRPNLDQLWGMPAVARLTLLALGVYSLIYGLVLTYGGLKRDRYLMPVFPAAMLMAAAGLWWLVNWAARRWPGSKLPPFLANGRWAGYALALVLALELGHVLSTHPFYYTYWSPLLGGGPVAMNVMMAEGGVDSAAVVQLNRRATAPQETLALLTGRDYAPAFAGNVERLTNGSPWITANHVLVRQYHFQTQKMDAHLMDYLRRQPPEIVDAYQGYIWAWVYPGPAAQFYAGSMLDGQAELLGYNLSGKTAAVGQPLKLKLFWQNHGYQPPAYIFVRLTDAAGFVWAETAAPPLPDFAATAYQPRTIVEGEAALEIPPGTPPGLYFIKMGIAAPNQPDIGAFKLPAEASQLVVEPPASQPTPPVGAPINQPLGEMTLLGAEALPAQVLTPQTPQPLTLFWQANGPVTTDYTVNLRLLDAAGRETARWQGRPARGGQPATGWQPGQIIRDPWLLDLKQANPVQPVQPGRQTLTVSLLNNATGHETAPVKLGQVEVADRLRRFEAPPLENPVNTRLGDGISLLGYNLEQAPITGGARFTLNLFWQAQQPISTTYTVFVQMLGPDGTVVGQHDGLPADGLLPTTAWETGEVVPDRHLIDFLTAANGDYRLIAGLYNPATGQRLPVVNATGQPAGDFIPLYTLTVNQPAP